jgi:PAS domain S-box-containing protein
MSENTKIPSYTEQERLCALYSYDVLDTEAEAEYGNMAKLAAQIFGVPFACISLVDQERQWIKASVGLEIDQSPRSSSFCQYTIAGSEVFEVQDTLLDTRFADNPFVSGDPYVRFYAGAPLVDADGYTLGALCIMDRSPNQITSEQKRILETLAGEVVARLSLKRRKQELHTENLRLEEMLNISSLSPEIHSILDKEGNVLFINAAVTNLLGYSVSEALKMNFWQVCYREDMAKVKATLAEGLVAGQKQFDLQFRVVGSLGLVRWFSWSMVTKNGRWYSYGRDITEIKQVQSELMKLSFVASKVNNGVVINDAENQVTWVNEAFEKITGFNLDDIKGKRLGDLISGPETDLALIQYAREQAKENQSFTIDLLGYKKDKTPIWLSIYNTVVLDEHGSVDIEVEIILDVTDKKRAEREMFEAKEQALQLSEAKEMFLSVMSHEIRNPLNAVIGMTHLLLGNDPKLSQINDLNILKFSGENLLHIINDILDFTKIETGNLELEHLSFSLKALANDIINSLQINANKNENQIELNFDDRIPAELLGDKTRLYQILMNLLGNAIKFTHKGKVELHMALQEDQNEKVLVEFQVKDNGIGIPADKQSYIFESFTQAKTDISRKYGGTGLGLAITKKLLKLYNSDIHVSSTEGQGTTFTFTLALDKVSEDKSRTGLINRNAEFAGRKVLVVDDNEINILIAKRILTNWGLDVEVASNGHEAIDKVMSTRFEIIFMDIRMPGIDGFETTSIIRDLEDEHYKSVPIVALTASSMHDDHSKYETSGMNGYIMKPFNPDDIRAVLSDLLLD